MSILVNFSQNGYPQKWLQNQNFEKPKKVYRSSTLMISRATLQPLRTISAACGLRTKRAIFGLFVNFCKNGYPQKWPKNQNFEKQKKVYRSLTLMISCAHLQPLRTISAAVGLRTKRAIFGPKSLKMPQKMTQKKYYKKTKNFFQKKKKRPERIVGPHILCEFRAFS